MAPRKILTVLGIALLAVGCSDRSPVQPNDQLTAPDGASLARTPATLLTDIPVTATLPGGGTFTGLLSFTELGLDEGELVGSGTLTGTLTVGTTVTPITRTFTDVAFDLTVGGTPSTCDVLNVDLGPVGLGVAGLVVDLPPISLDLRAQRGQGNLMGNLLCSLVRLQDAPPAAFFGRLVSVLHRINNLLNRFA